LRRGVDEGIDRTSNVKLYRVPRCFRRCVTNEKELKSPAMISSQPTFCKSPGCASLQSLETSRNGFLESKLSTAAGILSLQEIKSVKRELLRKSEPGIRWKPASTRREQCPENCEWVGLHVVKCDSGQSRQGPCHVVQRRLRQNVTNA
jgi:hypothetical protein